MGRSFRAGVIALVLMAAATTASADVELLGARETGCTIAVQFVGPIATVTETHELIGVDPSAVEAHYRFTVPAGAVVIDGNLRAGRAAGSTAVVVSAEALATTTPDADRLGLPADRGLIRWLATEDGGERVEARVYPLTDEAAAHLTIRWSAAARYDGGRLQLTIPSRGHAELAQCAVRLDARAGGGVRRFTAGYIDGMKIAVSGGRASAANARDLTVEVDPEWSGTGPVVAARSRAVTESSSVTSIAVYVPPRQSATALAPPRLLIAVDASKSMGAEGRTAAAALADGLIAAVPATTPTELVLFDRTARRELGAWTAAKKARPMIRQRIAAPPTTGGTDLGAALNLIASLVGDEPTRVVVITDAMLSTRVASADLLGAAMMPAQQVTLDVVIPVIPGAPLPDRATLDPLAAMFHGKVLVLRTSEVGAAAARLPRRLAEDQPVRELAVTLDGEPLFVRFPDELAPGAGALVHVSYAGPPARRVQLTAQRGLTAITVDGQALPAASDPLAAFAAGQGTIDAGTHALDGADALALARTTHAVTAAAALALLDPGARGNAARIELARATGAFTRNAPPTAAALDALAGPIAPSNPPPRSADDNLPASTYQYLIKYHLWPGVKDCYRAALRGKPRFSGTLEVTLEIARGEIHDARFGGTAMPSEFVACVAAAAYAMEVPTYDLDGLAETIAVVRKPIYLRAPTANDEEPVLSEDLGMPAVEPAAPVLEPTPLDNTPLE